MDPGGSGGDEGDYFDDAVSTAMASSWSACSHLNASTRLTVLFGFRAHPRLSCQLYISDIGGQCRIGGTGGRSFSLINGSGAALTMLCAADFVTGKWMDHYYKIDDFFVCDVKKCVGESSDVGVTDGQGLISGNVESSESDYSTTTG